MSTIFPAGLPHRIDSPASWTGPEMVAQPSTWSVDLTASEIADIEAAVGRAQSRAIPIARLTRAEFTLPRLAQHLAEVRAELLEGRGFVLLRGLPVTRWTLEQSALAFFGIGTHLGHARPQNAKGHVLGHVKDLGLSADDPAVRIYQTRERQTFHTDSSDIVGLLCLKTAQQGGDSALVSSVTLYNEMRRRWPDLAALLFEPLATDRRGEIPAGAKAYFEIPVFNWYRGHLSAIYQRQYIDSAQRLADAPRLTPAHVEALDLFDELANDPALHFMMTLAPGDVQFVHNHVLLHDRTAFVDHADPVERRHLLRLWLAPDEARALPAVYAQRYGSVTPGDRGGVAHPAGELHAPLEAV